MKTLALRRHSITDGPNNTLAFRGLELAKRQGQIASNKGISFTWLFYARFVETAQTALAFCDGLDYRPNTLPINAGLNYGELLAEIDLNQFNWAMKSGLSDFEAIRRVHGDKQTGEWADRAREAVLFMFNQMEHNESAVGFFHSPIIELMAWSCGVKADVFNWNRLGPMEGLVFCFDSPRKILVTARADQQPGLGG